ncbi:hypothetical protein HKD37_12G034559 [Glycine soja]
MNDNITLILHHGRRFTPCASDGKVEYIGGEFESGRIYDAILSRKGIGSFFHGLFPSGWCLLSPILLCLPLHLHGGKSPLKDLIEAQRSSLHRSLTSKLPSSGNQSTRASSRKNHNLGTNMSHHSSSVNGNGTSHKDPLSRILDELSSLKLWKEKQERKEKGKKRVEEISQGERKKIREEERRKIMKEMKREKYVSYSSHNSCKSLSEELRDYYEGRHRSNLRPHSHRREKERKPQEANIKLSYFHGKDNVEANLDWEIRVEGMMQSYPARALGRRLQVDWARDPREGPRVLMNLRAHLGGEAPSSMAYSLVDGVSSHLFSFVFRCISMLKDPASIEAPQASFHQDISADCLNAFILYDLVKACKKYNNIGDCFWLIDKDLDFNHGLRSCTTDGDILHLVWDAFENENEINVYFHHEVDPTLEEVPQMLYLECDSIPKAVENGDNLDDMLVVEREVGAGEHVGAREQRDGGGEERDVDGSEEGKEVQ